MLKDFVIDGDGNLLFYRVACYSHCHVCIVYKKHDGIYSVCIFIFIKSGHLVAGSIATGSGRVTGQSV